MRDKYILFRWYLEYEYDDLYIRNPCPKCIEGPLKGQAWNLPIGIKEIN